MFDPSKLNLDLENNGIKEDDNFNPGIGKRPEVEKEESSSKNENKIIPEIKNGQGELSGKDKIDYPGVKQEIDKNISNKKDDNFNPGVEKEEENKTKIIPREIKKEDKIIFDININSLTDLIAITNENEYDFFIIEPSEEAIKISFRKDKVEKEIKYIKYPIYSDILIKAKKLTKLEIDKTHIKQEGKGIISIKNLNYDIISKVVPSNFGEKLFIKTKKILDKKVIKKKKQTSVGQIFGFLGAAGLISLILGGGFITFIVLNAQTIDDVKFFYSLGINLNDINTFITKIVSLIFSILIFIETIFLIIFLFKLILTKKENKQKKIRYGIFSILFIIIVFLSATAWMIIDKKINSLPNWQEMAYGDIRVYDNAKLISDSFDKNNSLLKNNTDVIGPISVKYDLNYFAKKENNKGLKIKKFVWNFGGKNIVETLKPEIIHKFLEKGNHNVSLILKEINLKGEVIDKEVKNIPNINISNIVKINEKQLDNGGKEVGFDANSLSDLGKMKWVIIEGKKISTPWSGYTFRLPKPIFKETLIGLYINKKGKSLGKPDKLFVITSADTNNIGGEISYTRGIVKDLEFEFSIKDIKNAFGEGYITEFLWNIDGKTIKKVGKIDNQEKSSKILYTFKKYGENNVSVKLTNSSGKTKILNLKLNISKKLKLDKPLEISNDGKIMKNIKYDKNNNEYFINNLPVPTKLEFNARFIKPDKQLYILDKVEWDYNDNGNIDDTGKIISHNINTQGNHIIKVTYTFSHRKIKNKTIKLIEKIYISGVRKDAILDLKIDKPNNYIPVVVRFDASSSKIKNQNIVSFIWDYGDGITENRGSVVPGHRYNIPGNYIIKLKVTTDKGNEYSIQKKLILIPEPQSVKISSSFKKSPVYQGIDFSSAGSNGQISSYFWDFGDGSNSIEANPTHMYKKPGKYTVKLKLNFKNKNILEDKMDIEIITN